MSIMEVPPVESQGSLLPRTPDEDIIFDIWREVLELGEFSTHDDFFELGGDSMDAAQVMARVARVFEVEPGIASLFENRTIVSLAAVLLERRAKPMKGPATTGRALQPGYGPLSYAQERMWFLYQWDPSSPSYNMPAAVRFQGKLNVEILKQSLNEIVRRHEVLRAAFVT